MEPFDEHCEIIEGDGAETPETITLPQVGLYTCPMCQGRGVCTKSEAARRKSHRHAPDDRYSSTGLGFRDQNISEKWLPEVTVAEFSSYENEQSIQPSPKVSYKVDHSGSGAFNASIPFSYSSTSQNRSLPKYSGNSSKKKVTHKKQTGERVSVENIWPGLEEWPPDKEKKSSPTFAISIKQTQKEHPKAIYKRSSNTLSRTDNSLATLGMLSVAPSTTKSISFRSTDNTEVLSLLSEVTRPLQPQENIKFALMELDGATWQEVVHGLQTIVHISQWQPALVEPHIAVVYRVIVALLRGMRSHVTRVACQTARELFRTMQSTIRPEFDEVVGNLLGRTADLNRFIREDANEALDAMVNYLPSTACVRALLARGCRHRHPLVRSSTARLLTCCSMVVGPGGLIAQCTKRDARANLMYGAATLLADPNQETRSLAKKLFESLVEHKDFDSIFQSSLDEKLANKVKKAVILIKLNKRDLPA